ncbi:MAG TPA: DUF899 domain-containing protein [Solirubrobacteraceae bacterium]|nr:DUF899 domain-containing protein [Solirubrobacteraceae bacterium]
MSLPEIVTRDAWLEARTALLAREKELTRARDALAADRRRLPMVEVGKEYVFSGPDGAASLLDLFAGREQLIVRHFMFEPDWEEGCSSCTAGADEIADGLLEHLAVRGTSFAVVSRAPIEKLERYRAARGWTFPWYSSAGTDFNADFGVTVDHAAGAATYNYASMDDGWDGELPGQSCFLRVGDRVFHTYSTFARGMEALGGSYYWLDLTALGRQEEWEEPKGRAASARSNQPDFAS